MKEQRQQDILEAEELKRVFSKNLNKLLGNTPQIEVATQLGIKPATFSSWCVGKRMPRMDKIELLANFFDVPKFALIEDGLSILESSPINKEIPSDLLEIDANLNNDGHSEWVKYGNYLTEQPQYKKQDNNLKSIRHYIIPAAAGYASPIEGEDYEILELPHIPRGADFCITVSGDSMEPYIKDGSIVFVKRNADLEDFDVGVFYLDGDVYIKQVVTDNFRNVYLLSANTKREDANKFISANSDSSLICFGKVIISKLPQPIYRQL